MVVTALPAVMADLKVPIIRLESVIWVVTAYLLGYTVAMPLLGRLADVHGYVRVYWASLAVFGIGTTLVALSGEFEGLNGLFEPLEPDRGGAGDPGHWRRRRGTHQPLPSPPR